MRGPGKEIVGDGHYTSPVIPMSRLTTEGRIEGEEDEEFMMQETLLKRFSILVNGEETEPANVIERAVDLHALLVIGSSGYQKCVAHLWRGWLVQDENDPLNFIPFKKKAVTEYWAHFDPDRMRAPQYQNALQITMSATYLILYTIAINTINDTGDLDIIEGILYLFTAGFIFDEFTKFWKDKSSPCTRLTGPLTNPYLAAITSASGTFSTSFCTVL